MPKQNNDVVFNTYQIQFDLIITPLPYAIDLLCSIGDFAIYQKNYYIYTKLSKKQLISKLKKYLSTDEQILVKTIDNLDIFKEQKVEKPIKKITYNEASQLAMDRISKFLDDVYTELQNQLTNSS